MKVNIEYYAELREKSNKEKESISISHNNCKQLYTQLKKQYDFHLDWNQLGIAINHEIADWTQNLQEEDIVVFIPKVAGG